MKSLIYSTVFLVSTLLITPQQLLAQNLDCSKNRVTLGDVLAGLQAGYTAGTRSKSALAYGFASAFDGIATRGFVDPEQEVASFACENDYIVIAANVTSGINSNRSPREARESVDSGFGGIIVDVFIEVDGERVDHIQSATKNGNNPYRDDDTRAAFYTLAGC